MFQILVIFAPENMPVFGALHMNDFVVVVVATFRLQINERKKRHMDEFVYSYLEQVSDENGTLFWLCSGDADKILQVFEEIVNTHRRSPNVDKVLQFFIHKEDPDRLQKGRHR